MVQVSYPGVYIEEVPSGNRTITGVSTSITAFVGRTRKGAADRAVRITNYAAFEREFGGLWQHSPLSYAVRQFYQNGGSDAAIVRIANTRGEAASVNLDNGEAAGLTLVEAVPGSHGHNLRVEVTDDAGTIHVTVTEYTRSASGAEVVVRVADYSAADAAGLEAALAADESLVVVSPDTAGFGALPVVSGPFEFEEAVAPASAAHAVLPLDAETIGLQAAAAGEDGNNLAVSVLPSASDPGRFSLVVEERQPDGSYVLQGTVTSTTLSNLAADVAAVAGIGITVTGDPSSLVNPPLPAIRIHLDDGDAATEASLQLPTEGLAVLAANPGAWGDQLQLRVDHETADPADPTLFNLTVELLNADDRVVSVETHRNVSIDPDASRYVQTILEQASLLARVADPLPVEAPAPTGDPVRLDGGNDGGPVEAVDITGPGMQGNKEGLYLLEDTDLFNLMVIPPLDPQTDVPEPLWTAALAYCRERRAMLLIDPPSGWNRPDQAISGMAALAGLRDPNSVLYFPRIRAADPLKDNTLATFVPSGVMAGLIARTDAERGFWKAPAGLEAGLVGVRSLAYALIDGETGQLNPLGINCLQAKPAAGPVAWGARTLFGDDRLASEWKYLPVRRTALMIEESLYRGIQWAVFEPNDRPLWQQLRLAVDNFMNNLFRRGAFQGATPDEAYFVKCDDETTTQADIDAGVVNVEVGFSPLKPAEFVVIRIRQIAGQAEA